MQCYEFGQQIANSRTHFIPVVFYDSRKCLLMTLGTNPAKKAMAMVPVGEERSNLARSIGGILGKVHSATYVGHLDSSERETAFADLVLLFRGSAAQEFGSIDLRVWESWSLFVEETRVNRVCQVHGDLSPRNILYGEDGHLLLFDFEFSPLDDPASDIGFFLGHSFLTMILHPEVTDEVCREIRSFWQGYLETIHPKLLSEVEDLEKRVVKHCAVTLFYRSWFQPSWKFESPDVQMNVRQRAIRLFGKSNLENAVSTS